MSELTPIVPVPPVTLASDFPTPADRPAGTYNAKAAAWASSENAMASSVKAIADATKTNAQAAHDRATLADASAQIAVTAKGLAEDAAGAAGISAGAALASKNAAALSADAAATSAGEALVSKNAAALSAENAGLSEAAALVSRNAAAQSETNAATSASEALASANAAALSASNAADSALTAQNAASTATDSTNFKGRWADLSGPLATPATVYHANRYWTLLDDLADVAASEPGVSEDWAKTGGGIAVMDFDDRAMLRSGTAADGEIILIPEVGLFRFHQGADDFDDDETCFRSPTGCWVIEAVHPDAIYALTVSDESAQDDRQFEAEQRLDEAEQRLDEDASGRVLLGSGASGITSVAATAQAAFTVTVAGAEIGDPVTVSPRHQLDGRVAMYARVTAENTVTVYLNNPSAAAATITSGVFDVSVFKE